MTYANHLINRLPVAAIDGKTPIEKWRDTHATDFDTLHIFGCPAYYHVQDDKLDPRAKKALFMGYNSGVKGYRLWCLESKKIIISRDVTFNESEMLKSHKHEGSNEASSSNSKTEEGSERVEFIPILTDRITEEEGQTEVESPVTAPPPESIAINRPRR